MKFRFNKEFVSEVSVKIEGLIAHLRNRKGNARFYIRDH